MTAQSTVTEIGVPPWKTNEVKELVGSFAEIYARRPIANNQGGMRAPHMFAVFAALRALSPSVVVESGVWKGAGTWLIEQALPNTHIIALDPSWKLQCARAP